MTDAQLIADCLVSLAAVFAVVSVIFVLRRQSTRDAPSRRLSFALGLVGLLLVARVAWWMTGSQVFAAVALGAASLVPLATILLAEALLRRHAPSPVKRLLVTATPAFLILSLFPESAVDPYRGIGILAFQMFAFATAGWLFFRRDRASLSAQENRLIDRMTASLAIILPLLATDFRLGWPDLPVRLGGIAILVSGWLIVAITKDASWRRLLSPVLIGLAAGVGIGLMDTADTVLMIQTGAITVAACLATAIAIEISTLSIDTNRAALLNFLASGSFEDRDTFIDGLMRQPALTDAIVLRESDLGDFDLALLTAAFADDNLRDVGAIQAMADGMARDQLTNLVERYSITHLMRIETDPLAILVFSLPAIAIDAETLQALRVGARLASHIPERAW